MSVAVAVDEVQGNVLHSYGEDFGFATYLRCVVRPGMGEAAVRLIGRLTEKEVTFGQAAGGGDPLAREPRLHLRRVAGTAGAARASAASSLRSFARAHGTRAGWLGDTWPQKSKFRDAHILLSVVACSDTARDERVARLERLIEAAGEPLALVESQSAALLEDRRREHFGFSDGHSQPAIAGVDPDPTGNGIYATTVAHGRAARLLTELGVRNPPRRWRFSRAGEFLLGYVNEDGTSPAGPRAPLGPNGTFMVYRKMVQHVDVFKRFVSEAAAELGLDPDVLRAKILGRWPDGTPLASSPVEDPTIADQPPARERVPLRRRSERARLPARRARPAREPARRPAGWSRAHDAPPDHPARDALRRRR